PRPPAAAVQATVAPWSSNEASPHRLLKNWSAAATTLALPKPTAAAIKEFSSIRRPTYCTAAPKRGKMAARWGIENTSTKDRKAREKTPLLTSCAFVFFGEAFLLIRPGQFRDPDIPEAEIRGRVVALQADRPLVHPGAIAGTFVRWPVVGEVGGLVAADPDRQVLAVSHDGHGVPLVIVGDHLAGGLTVVDGAGAEVDGNVTVVGNAFDVGLGKLLDLPRPRRPGSLAVHAVDVQ